MILELLFVATLVQAPPPNAGPNDSVTWDHDGVNTEHYEIRWDNIAWNSTNLEKTAKIPALEPGLHVVDVRACNFSNCSDPLTLSFNMIAMPVPVSNLRLATSPVATTFRTKPAVKPTKPVTGVKK